MYFMYCMSLLRAGRINFTLKKPTNVFMAYSLSTSFYSTVCVYPRGIINVSKKNNKSHCFDIMRTFPRNKTHDDSAVHT